MIISITILDRVLKRNIAERSYAVADLEQIREQLQVKIHMRQKGFVAFLAMVIVMFGMLQIMTGMRTGFDEMFWKGCAFMAVANVLVIAVVWILCIGIAKWQFNHVIKKAYPECAQSLKV